MGLSGPQAVLADVSACRRPRGWSVGECLTQGGAAIDEGVDTDDLQGAHH
jgi:hypothetical protein